MIFLPPSQFHLVSSLFERIDHNRAIVFSVIEGNSPGQVYVDEAHHPTVALLYAAGAFFYIAGDENRATARRSLVPLLFDMILPQIADPELVLFSFSPAWRGVLDDHLRAKGAIRIARKAFRFDPQKFARLPDPHAAVPAGFELRAIDRELAERFPAYRPIADPATQRLGFCLLHAGEVVSACTAVFVGCGEAEIDIHTTEAYRRRGFARLTASAFITACLERGLTPNWSCWPERQASQALALRLGFEPLPDVPAHYWAPGM
jgi:RimJ/RimL family protein N-acetyltransferase